jgi:ABC-type Na+ efflux pump permease subunit
VAIIVGIVIATNHIPAMGRILSIAGFSLLLLVVDVIASITLSIVLCAFFAPLFGFEVHRQYGRQGLWFSYIKNEQELDEATTSKFEMAFVIPLMILIGIFLYKYILIGMFL